MYPSKQKYNPSSCVYSSKFFRVFFHPSQKASLEISISKKYFRLAVSRNQQKRRIREIFRKESLLKVFDGGVIFSVFSPFGELSYARAEEEIKLASIEFLKKHKK